MPLLAELQFGAVLTYVARGTTPEMEQAKAVTHSLKRDGRLALPDGTRPTTTEYLCSLLRNAFQSCPALANVLTSDCALVPVPGAALRVTDGLWVPERLARAMIASGFGSQVLPCVTRTVAVQKSATALPGQRPSAHDHYNSMAVETRLAWPSKLLLVDDVVTKGASLIGAASRLREAAPHSRIVGFAMVRTLRSSAEFQSWFNPVVGRITVSNYGECNCAL